MDILGVAIILLLTRVQPMAGIIMLYLLVGCLWHHLTCVPAQPIQGKPSGTVEERASSWAETTHSLPCPACLHACLSSGTSLAFWSELVYSSTIKSWLKTFLLKPLQILQPQHHHLCKLEPFLSHCSGTDLP